MININKDAIIKEFKLTIENISNVSKLIEEKNIFFKKNVAILYDKLREIKNEEKKEFGQLLNQLKIQLETIFEEQKNSIEEMLNNKNDNVDYDINLVTLDLKKGSFHILTMIQNEIMDFFKQLNFEIVNGDEVVSVNDNFDKLNINVNHPVRQTNDSFYLNNCSKMLRTHCTANTSQQINNKNHELKILSYGSVYRNDDDDLTHSHQFNQIDFVWIKEGLSIAHLKWVIDQLLKHLFGSDIKTRYRLSYFPFTEPSFEVDIGCFKCHGKGCSLCKNSGWIEILGAGLLHQNVLDQANINFTKTALAAGFGLDRIAMIKYGINDIRYLYNNDFRLINQLKNKSEVK